MARSWRFAGAWPWVAAAIVGGCRSYEARPLDPERTRADFEARALDDPALASFAREVRPELAAFPPASWSADDWIVVALFERGDLRAAALAENQALAGVAVAAQRPNPTLGLAIEAVGNSGASLAPWLFGLTSSWTIETHGKRDLRVAAAELDVRAAEIRTRELANSIVVDVESACARAYVAARRELAAERVRAARAARLATIERLVDAGELARHETSAAALSLSEAELAVERAAGAAAEARAALAGAVGLLAERLASAGCDGVRALVAAPSAAAARSLGLRSRTDLRVAALEFDRADLELRVAIAAQYPNLQLSPGFTWDQGERKFALGAAFEVPVLDDHSAAIARASAAREAARAEFAAVQERALARIEERRTEYERARGELDAARAQLALHARIAERAARRVAGGEAERLEQLDADCAAALAERDVLDAEERALLARCELERELGARSEGASAEPEAATGLDGGVR